MHIKKSSHDGLEVYIVHKERYWILWPFAHPLPLNNGAPGCFADSILGIHGVTPY